MCEAHFVDGISDAQIRQLFNAARDADYEQLIEQLIEQCHDVGPAAAAGGPAADGCRQRLRRARKRFEQIVAPDHFGAAGRTPCEALLAWFPPAPR